MHLAARPFSFETRACVRGQLARTFLLLVRPVALKILAAGEEATSVALTRPAMVRRVEREEGELLPQLQAFVAHHDRTSLEATTAAASKQAQTKATLGCVAREERRLYSYTKKEVGGGNDRNGSNRCQEKEVLRVVRTARHIPQLGQTVAAHGLSTQYSVVVASMHALPLLSICYIHVTSSSS